MEESKNPCSSSDQEKKSMFIKIGGVGGGGGGIGAVILLGGALASAAIASAFIVGKKERRSGKGRRPRHQNPPPELPSNEEPKEDLNIIKSEKDSAQSLILDEKPGIEINGGTPDNVIDVEKNDNGYVIINDGFQLCDEKLSKDMILTEEDFTKEISNESDGFNQVCIDKEMVEGEPEAVEIIETKTRKERNNTEVLESEVTLVDEAVEEDIDQMEIEKSPKMEEKSEEIELVHGSDNGEIDEVKYEVAMEENELDSGIEVAVVNNSVEGVDIDQTEPEKEVCVQVKIDEKELEGCGSEDKEINGVEIGETIEETTIDVAKFGIEMSEEETSYNEKSFVDDSLGVQIFSRLAKSQLEKEIQLGQNGQETQLPMVLSNQETMSTDVTLSEESELDSGIEVAVVNNTVEGVDIGQTEPEKEVCVEVKIDEKELEGCGSEDKEINGVEIGETIEETTIDVAKFGIEMTEEETSYNEKSFVNDSLGVQIFSRLAKSQLEKEIQLGPNGQETHLPVVLGNQETMSTDVTLSETVVVSESYNEDGQITTLREHEENVNGSVEEVALPIEIVEVKIQEDEVVKQIEEHLVKEHIKEPDEEIVPEIREEVGLKGGEDNQSFVQSDMQVEVNGEKTEALSENKEENVCTDENNPTPEIVPMPKEELISVGNEVATNDEVPESFCQQKNHDDDDVEKEIGEIEYSSESIEIDNATRTDDVIMETSEDEVKGEEHYDNEADLSDEVEESSVGTEDSSLEPNSEAVRPAVEVQQVKLIEQEVIGKIQEDKIIEKENEFEEQIKAAKGNLKKSTENSTINVVDSKRESQKKYMMEMALQMNSTRWRMVIATLSVLSSLSCSWFFGLSFVKLCLIVFLTMVLSKIHGY